MPIIDGCTSISRTGRYYPVNYFFKSLIFISGIFIILYWYKNYFFFNKHFKSNLNKIALVIGLLSIIFLFLYIIFLGESNHYKFFRKIGIFIYILFAIISEFLLSIIYLKNRNYNLFSNNFIKIKLYLSSILIVLGILLFPLMIMKIENVTNLRNAISWNYFLLIQISYLSTYFCWKKYKN
tara:strand:+ start:126 stop:668 length:543 start_codon:yes stop_codon:yes gene_type:complete